MCVHECMYLFIYVCTHIALYTCIHCMYMNVCVCCAYIHIYVYICVCVCVGVCVCMCRKDDFGVGAIAGTMEKIAADPEARDENGVVLVAMGNPSL